MKVKTAFRLATLLLPAFFLAARHGGGRGLPPDLRDAVSDGAALEQARNSFAAEPKAAPQYGLSRYDELNLAVDKGHPAARRYLEMIKQLKKAWGNPDFSKEELRQAQRDVAAATGLAIVEHPEAIEISPEGGHWLNRWAAGLRRSKGVRLYWSPLHNHYGGDGASYSPGGWIVGDDLGPLLLKPSTPLLHEFLHAYVDRGRHAGELLPLKTRFYSHGWQDGYPKSEGRVDGGYVHSRSFSAEELMTNLHSAYDRAGKIAAAYGAGGEGWKGSALEQAPEEVRQLVSTLDTPIFLAESIREMSAQLLPGTVYASEGLRGKALKKSFSDFSGSLSSPGEDEKRRSGDIGFYALELEEVEPSIEVRYPTLKAAPAADPDGDAAFPVYFLRGGYGVTGALRRAAVETMDLADPEVQEILIAAAAGRLAKDLAALKGLTESLEPEIERLKSLQKRARGHVDLELVREIQETSRKAFLGTIFFFTRPTSARAAL